MKYLLIWKQRARVLKADAFAIYLACRDPRTPWYVKALAAGVAAYALSPIDLIPDFIPVLGYLDDLVILPLGVALVLKLIPPHVLAECRQAAREQAVRMKRSCIGAMIVVLIWIVVVGAISWWIFRGGAGR